MNKNKQEEEKRQLHKLLREYNMNAGMAGFVCGKPVELMPQSEQERYISGFCTAQNISILEGSIKNLKGARNLELDEDEIEKIENAIPTLESLVSLFCSYMNNEIEIDVLREKVRSLLEKPIPETQEGLVDSLSHMIETLDFLAGQDLSTKDEWDTLMDCSQMHDALSRTARVCDALLAITGGGSIKEGAVNSTRELVARQIDFMESVFKRETNSELAQDQFRALAADLKAIWSGD